MEQLITLKAVSQNNSRLAINIIVVVHLLYLHHIVYDLKLIAIIKYGERFAK